MYTATQTSNTMCNLTANEHTS